MGTRGGPLELLAGLLGTAVGPPPGLALGLGLSEGLARATAALVGPADGDEVVLGFAVVPPLPPEPEPPPPEPELLVGGGGGGFAPRTVTEPGIAAPWTEHWKL
ncbi:MAG: hypothetical protein WAT58_10170 [Candidatus Dormiibacterota bacterium]